MSLISADEAAAADTLRGVLVEELRTARAITTPEVEAAFRTVPRHAFAPEASLEQAYANDIVRTKYDEHGITTSSVSAPWLQATMLEQARIRPGMRCLEIGSGGYNAALMAELVGPAGSVTTIDIDAEVTGRARRFLDAAGYERVEVVIGDAEHGVAPNAPYDRIVVTVGMWDIPPAWRDQLTTHSGDGASDRAARMVVPLRMRGLKRTLAFRCEGESLVSDEHMMAGFVDVQGAGAHSERLITLYGEEVGLRFEDDLHVPVDGAAMRAALTQSRVSAWSGVTFGDMEPFDILLLWLATSLDRYGMLSRARTDTARELVNPASPIATPTLLSDSGFAYLAFRASPTEPGRFEFGAHAHGPDACVLADLLVEQVRAWDGHHRGGPPARITVTPTGSPVPPEEGRPVRRLRKRHCTVTISWPEG